MREFLRDVWRLECVVEALITSRVQRIFSEPIIWAEDSVL